MIATSSQTARPEGHPATNINWSISCVLGAWFALIWFLGAREAFVVSTGVPPLALLIALVAPIALFAAGYRLSGAVRKFVSSADLRFVAALHAWRFAGFGFLALNAYNILPDFFAWPAGLGDMAIAISAPWMVAALIRNPEFAASRTFVAWNILGIADLMVAVGSGAVVPLLRPDLVQTVTTAPMVHLPLLLIPAFLVPMFIIAHLIALIRARQIAATGNTGR